MGPLGKIWQLTKTATDSNSNQAEFNLEDFKNLTEQIIVRLGQSFYHINYNRRLAVLTSIIKNRKAKKLLKDKAEIFSESYNDLFGGSFKEDWCSSLKVKRKR